MRAVVVLGLITACGDNLAEPPSAVPQSGTRLRLEHLEYEDGSRQLASTTTVHDAERAEVCTIRRWSDGLRYCTPPAHTAVFTDAACTHEVARIRVVDLDSPYALHEFFVATERLPSRLYRIGEPVPDEVTATYELRGEACIARLDFTATDTYRELGEEVPREALVHTIRVALPGDRLDALVDTSPDGLQLPAAMFDRDHGRSCQPARRDGGVAECVFDEGVTSSFQFGDPACTAPVVVVPATMSPPELTRRGHPGGCTTIHAVTALQSTTSTFSLGGDVCTEVPLEVGARVFATTPIELAQLARRRVASARLQPIEDGDTRFPDPYLFDTELGHECSILNLAGTERCVPSFETGYVRFVDPACTAPLLVAEVLPVCGPPIELVIHPTDRTFHPIGPPSGTIYEITTGDRCVEATPPLGGVFHAAGPAIPPARFPAAMRVID